MNRCYICNGLLGTAYYNGICLVCKQRENKKPLSLEDGAKIAHSQWSDWMKHLFSKCTFLSDGTVIIPSWAVSRWTQQMTTEYADLSEQEKQSDRDEAQKYIDWLTCDHQPKEDDGNENNSCT